MNGTSWSELTIAVVGGDEREQEISRLAGETGAHVRAFGFPWPEAGILGVEAAPSAAHALKGARYALFPIPGIAVDGSLFAPSATEPIVPDRSLLAELGPHAHVILGAADEKLRDAAAACDVQLHEYESDRELMLLRAPAIVEGALRLAIENTTVTLHGEHIAVVGFGTIGSQLTRTLLAIGARVTVAARNPVQRAAAYALGADATTLDDLPDLAGRVVAILSTVPAPVVGRAAIERLARGSLVMDLAAPPGGADLDAARSLGHRAIWARGLGRRAPVTVGRSQWQGIRRLIEDIERKGTP